MTDTNPRDLIQRLADELYKYECLTSRRPPDCIPAPSPLIDEARAYLSQPEPEEPTDEEIEKSFQLWWFNEGSGMRPSNGEDQEEHVRRVSQIAWSNGAYVARWGRPAIQPEPKGLTDEELLQIAAATIDPYEDGIAIGEYEAETECAVEAYGSELIAFARAVLSADRILAQSAARKLRQSLQE